MVIKGRERIVRRKIKNFTDLPVDKQEVFKKIKQIIVCRHLKRSN
jgi:hypothetical protein